MGCSSPARTFKPLNKCAAILEELGRPNDLLTILLKVLGEKVWVERLYCIRWPCESCSPQGIEAVLDVIEVCSWKLVCVLVEQRMWFDLATEGVPSEPLICTATNVCKSRNSRCLCGLEGAEVLVHDLHWTFSVNGDVLARRSDAFRNLRVCTLKFVRHLRPNAKRSEWCVNRFCLAPERLNHGVGVCLASWDSIKPFDKCSEVALLLCCLEQVKRHLQVNGAAIQSGWLTKLNSKVSDFYPNPLDHQKSVS